MLHNFAISDILSCTRRDRSAWRTANKNERESQQCTVIFHPFKFASIWIALCIHSYKCDILLATAFFWEKLPWSACGKAVMQLMIFPGRWEISPIIPVACIFAETIFCHNNVSHNRKTYKLYAASSTFNLPNCTTSTVAKINAIPILNKSNKFKIHLFRILPISTHLQRWYCLHSTIVSTNIQYT